MAPSDQKKAAMDTIHDAARKGNMPLLLYYLAPKNPLNPGLEAGGGLEVDELDEDKFTALHWAADKNQLQVAKTLLAKGAKVNAQNAALETPLHYAAAWGHYEMSEFLVSNGANVNAVNHAQFEHTPLDKCKICQRGDWQVVAELLKGVRQSSTLPAPRRGPLRWLAAPSARGRGGSGGEVGQGAWRARGRGAGSGPVSRAALRRRRWRGWRRRRPRRRRRRPRARPNHVRRATACCSLPWMCPGAQCVYSVWPRALTTAAWPQVA